MNTGVPASPHCGRPHCLPYAQRPPTTRYAPRLRCHKNWVEAGRAGGEGGRRLLTSKGWVRRRGSLTASDAGGLCGAKLQMSSSGRKLLPPWRRGAGAAAPGRAPQPPPRLRVGSSPVPPWRGRPEPTPAGERRTPTADRRPPTAFPAPTQKRRHCKDLEL